MNAKTKKLGEAAGSGKIGFMMAGREKVKFLFKKLGGKDAGRRIFLRRAVKSGIVALFGLFWLAAMPVQQKTDSLKPPIPSRGTPADSLPAPDDSLRQNVLRDSLNSDTLRSGLPDSVGVGGTKLDSTAMFTGVDTTGSRADSSGGRAGAAADTLPPVRSLDRIVPNNAFRVGEKLKFRIKFGMFRAGEATMEVEKELPEPGNRRALRIVSKARSAKFFDKFFKVRDSMATFVDTQGIFSWRFFKHQREGSYKVDLDVNYDQLHGLAHVIKIRYNDDDKMTIRKKEDVKISIPPYVVDILAAFYYVRTQHLEVGMPISFPSHDNKKIYDMRVIVQRKEKVKVPAGTFECFLVQPQLKGEALFKQKGKLWLWLTADQYKIPVKMKSKALVGSITTELVEMSGVGPEEKAKKE